VNTKSTRCIMNIVLLACLMGGAQLQAQSQRRFFVKKKKPYAFSLFVGSVRGMGAGASVRIVKKVNAEFLVGVSNFINMKYVSPYPGNTVSFSPRLRYLLFRDMYISGGYYTGLYDICSNTEIIKDQIFKWVNGATVSIGFRNLIKKNVHVELGAVFGLPDELEEVVAEGIQTIYRVRVKRESGELSFMPLATIRMQF